MVDEKFAIIDIETTGTTALRDKIIEIAIIILEKDVEVARYSTLINPERSIPLEITRITGITNSMIEDAPRFYEVAKDIIKHTEGCIFVAHNVHFDYSFIQKEFAELGYDFTRKKLCTLQLAKRNFKGLHSYSLGNLIKYFDIAVDNRHRAMDDTVAAAEIFKRILALNPDYSMTTPIVKGLLQDVKLPPHIDRKTVDDLPETCGVYIMRNQLSYPVYIGKSINIRKRILQHFSQLDNKSNKMLHLVSSIDYVETGNDLMASLYESKMIKDYSPEINRAQRNKSEPICIYYEKNNQGIYQIKQCLDDNSTNTNESALRYCASKNIAKRLIDSLIIKYSLCQVINQAKKESIMPCAERLNMHCYGICEQEESIEDYNARFATLIAENQSIFHTNFMIIDRGRTLLENAVVIVQDGYCRAIGYLDRELSYNHIDEIKDQLEHYRPSIESNGIIRNYLKQNPKTKRINF